jgi:Na+-driven multidrug efflux pump
MYSQIIATVFHVLFNQIFVNVMDLGIIGTGISSFFTFSILLLINFTLTMKQNKLKEATDISIFDLRAR